ncbi:MAG: hypothetical protein R3A48_02385 [Polyangiales bacterium]
MDRSSISSSDRDARRGAAASLLTCAAALGLLAWTQSYGLPTRALQDESWYITRPRIYSEDPRGADILGLGDSRMGCAFNPSVVERVALDEAGVRVRVWNGALPGAGPVTHLAWVLRALAHRHPPRMVLLSISPYMFSSRVMRAPQKESLPTIYRVSDVPSLLRAGATAEDTLTAFTGAWLPPFRVRPRLVELFTKFNGVQAPASRGEQGFEDHPSVPLAMQRTRAAGRVTGYRPELLRRTAGFGNDTQGYFIECLRLLREARVTTVVLDSLSASQMDEVMGPDSIYPEHIRWVRAQAERFGATFVDAHRPPSTSDEDFTDVDHVGTPGSVRFTNWLAHTAIVPLLGGPRVDRPATCTTVFDFEGRDLAGWAVEGLALAAPVVAGPTRSQLAITGYRGEWFVNTYHPQFSDAVTGSATSPAFTLSADTLRLRVGGGRGPDTGVELLVDGARVAEATGENSEALREVVLDVRAWRGRSARLKVRDASGGSWGHVLVDDVALCPGR